MTKLYGTVTRNFDTIYYTSIADAEKDGYVNQQGLNRKNIFEAVKKSLERLQLDYIDVLQCECHLIWSLSETNTDATGHRFDPNTPIEETVSAEFSLIRRIC